MTRLHYFVGCCCISVTLMLLVANGVELAPGDVSLVLTTALAPLVALRLRNTGLSAWWTVGVFLPLAHLAVALRAATIAPASKNNPWDGWAKALVVLWVVAMIAPAIVAPKTIPSTLLGVWGMLL